MVYQSFDKLRLGCEIARPSTSFETGSRLLRWITPCADAWVASGDRLSEAALQLGRYAAIRLEPPSARWSLTPVVPVSARSQSKRAGRLPPGQRYRSRTE